MGDPESELETRSSVAEYNPPSMIATPNTMFTEYQIFRQVPIFSPINSQWHPKGKK